MADVTMSILSSRKQMPTLRHQSHACTTDTHSQQNMPQKMLEQRNTRQKAIQNLIISTSIMDEKMATLIKDRRQLKLQLNCTLHPKDEVKDGVAIPKTDSAL